MTSPPYLTAPEEFRQAYREGKRIASAWIVIYARVREPGPARIGIAARGQRGGAVQRNRAKRRLREASVLAYDTLPSGVDVVIVPRVSAAGASFEELVSTLKELFARARPGAAS